MTKKIAFVLSALAAASLGSVACAQTIKTPTKVKPEIAKQLKIDPSRLRPNFTGGSTGWVSPMLLNAPGTISGEQYTVNGKVVKKSFGLSVINPSAQHVANAAVVCFTSTGQQLTRYTTALPVPKLGATNWLSSSVTPPATTDGAHEDKDEIWCAVSADIPVVVFGWSERQFGTEVTRANFSLERVEAAQP